MLQASGCEKIFKEKVSGAKSDRAELAKLLKALCPGDVLIVTRLDRLCRNVRDLLNILHSLSEKEIGFRSLVDTWADTTTAHGRLLTVMLAGIAEFERSLILSRTSEGRKRAMDRGVKFGRKPKLTPFQQQEALERLARGDTQTAVARSYGVDQTTISALAKRMQSSVLHQ
jgi:DNA invertase Pin-like site-specific DNA recombinase